MNEELYKKILDNFRETIEKYTGKNVGITDSDRWERHEGNHQEGEITIEYWYKDSIWNKEKE